MGELLKNKSAVELRQLAREAMEIAEDLEKQQPSVELALLNGVQDIGYRTVRNGYVFSYRGEARITMSDGSFWKAIRHGPKGTASDIYKQGYVEFIKEEL